MNTINHKANNKHKSVAVLGEGAFGTAMACLLADCGLSVNLWCHDPQVVHQIHEARVNSRYMPDVCLVDRIHPTKDLSEALSDSELIFVATPVTFLRTVLEKAQPFYTSNQIWVMLSKGIECKTLMMPTQILDDVFGESCRSAVISGPTFARELVQKQPTRAVVASNFTEIEPFLHTLLVTDYFNTEIVSDPLGVQMCAAYKNVVALGMGILQGAGFGENAGAALFTSAFHEMGRTVVAIGGEQQTVISLAGIGDLALTAYSRQSRNVELGRRIGKGESLKDIETELGVLPEGVNTVFALYELSRDTALNLLLVHAINGILDGELGIEDLLEACL